MRSPGPLLVTLLLLATLLAGCGGRATETPASREAPAAEATPGAQAAAPAAPAQPSHLTVFDLQVAYQLLLQQYVDPLDHEQLLKAARKALRDSMLENGALPLDTMPLD